MLGKRVRAGLTLTMVLNLVFASLIFAPLVAAATVNVTPVNFDGWQFAAEGPTGSVSSGSLVFGPGSPPVGNGSAELVVDGTGRQLLFKASPFMGVRLDTISALSYSTYQQTGAPAQTAISLQLNIDYDLTDGNTAWQGRLIYEPYQDATNTVTTGVWQNWDALSATAKWWSSGAPGNGTCPQGSPCTWAAVKAAFPNAGIHSVQGAINFRAGGPWAGGFRGSVDNFSITIGGANTLYNFDQIPQCSTTCYVDGATGDDTLKGGTSPADAKKTIQAAANTVNSGGTVIVAPGTYPERVVIGTPLTLQGPNAGVNPNTGTRSPEATIVPPTNNYNGSTVASSLLVLNADGISINGIKLDGDNAALAGGLAMNGADVNVYYGIINNYADSPYTILSHANNTTITNTILQNFGEGISLFATAVPSQGTQIANNRFDNMASADEAHRGILLGDNFYASVTGNVMTRVYIGIQTNNFSQAGSGYVFSNNQIASYRRGMLHNLQYSTATTATISNNTFTAANHATWNAPGATTTNDNVGLLIWSIQGTVSVNVTNNNADGNAIGVGVWNVPTTNTVAISGGTLTNNNYGVQLFSCEARYGSGSQGKLSVAGVTILNSAIAGLAVLDNPQAKTVTDGSGTACTTSGTQPQLLTVSDTYVVGPGQAGVLADGSQARLSVAGSSIQANTTGIVVRNGAMVDAAGLQFNVIVANGTGLNTTGASGAINAENNWWGCNAGPGGPGCDTAVGTADTNPWLTLRLTRVPGGATAPGGTPFGLTADIIINSNSQDTSAIDTILDGTPVAFAVVSGGGTVVPATTGTVNGRANATYTAPNVCGPVTVSAQSDDQTVTTTVTLNTPCTSPPPMASPQAVLTLTTVGSGSVEVTPPGGSFTSTTQSYAVGTTITLVPAPAEGQRFVGWTVDGASSGWASPLTIAMAGNRTVEARFDNTRTFTDVTPGRADYAAITELASRGYILGYGDGNFGPDNGVLRSEMAALIARSTPRSVAGNAANLLQPPGCIVKDTWDCEVWNDNSFTDLAGLDPNLRRNILALAHYQVALGYGNGRYGPSDPVTYAQTISFITRAMVAKGYWVDQPGAPLSYSGVPAVHTQDVRTFTFYTGDIPSAPTTAAGWNANATRGWFAQALWAALNSYWGTDGNLPDGRPGGGFAP